MNFFFEKFLSKLVQLGKKYMAFGKLESSTRIEQLCSYMLKFPNQIIL